MPVYIAKAGGFFFIVFGVIALHRGAWSRSTRSGPTGPTTRPRSPRAPSRTGTWASPTARCACCPAGSEFDIFGHTLSLNIVHRRAGVAAAALHRRSASTRSSRRWVTGDKREHHLLDRPRNAPTRTGIGDGRRSPLPRCSVSPPATTSSRSSCACRSTTSRWFFRIGLLRASRRWRSGSPRRICLRLQRRDRDTVLHGRETRHDRPHRRRQVLRAARAELTPRPAGCWCSTRPWHRSSSSRPSTNTASHARRVACPRPAQPSRGSTSRMPSTPSRPQSSPPRTTTARSTRRSSRRGRRHGIRDRAGGSPLTGRQVPTRGVPRTQRVRGAPRSSVRPASG